MLNGIVDKFVRKFAEDVQLSSDERTNLREGIEGIAKKHSEGLLQQVARQEESIRKAGVREQGHRRKIQELETQIAKLQKELAEKKS